MPVPRSFLVLIPLALARSTALAASPAAPGTSADTTPRPAAAPAAPAPATPPPATVTSPAAAPAQASPPISPDEIKREVLEEVRRKELDKEKADIQQEVQYVENAADARNYDEEQLKALKETVNLLQLHGYFRTRGDLFTNASLGEPVDPAGYNLFPVSHGSSNLGVADMRLRLNPVLRVSDRVSVYAQIDALDNAVLGGNPQLEPFYGVGAANVGAPITSSAVLSSPINVERVWAEIQTPVGLFSFGRMPFNFGEGMVYNDGNCLNCDFGTTFDGGRFTVGPFLGGHLVTIGADYLDEGVTSTGLQEQSTGLAIPLQQLAAAYRFSLQLTKVVPPLELKRRLENNEVVVQYGALGAYRLQAYQTVSTANGAAGPNNGLQKVGANLGEADGYVQLQYQHLRIAAEGAFFGGQIQDNLSSTGVSVAGQALYLLQGAGTLNAQYSFLKQDALLVSLLFGIASGDNSYGMGAKPYQVPSGQTSPYQTVKGDIDGPQYYCPSTTNCPDRNIDNFQLNPDFRIDQLLWRFLYTDITSAWFARLEGRYKLGGRPSGGGTEEGFEFTAAAVYSQAIFGQDTPSGSQTPMGVEFDASISYTSHEHFFASVIAGFLVPLAGMQEPGAVWPTLGQIYRGVVGVTF